MAGQKRDYRKWLDVVLRLVSRNVGCPGDGRSESQPAETGETTIPAHEKLTLEEAMLEWPRVIRRSEDF